MNPKPIALAPVEINRDTFGYPILVEFPFYESTANRYDVPDMVLVQRWCNENCSGVHGLIGIAFMGFDEPEDALLCSLTFR